jgi:hypothetical protein
MRTLILLECVGAACEVSGDVAGKLLERITTLLRGLMEEGNDDARATAVVLETVIKKGRRGGGGEGFQIGEHHLPNPPGPTPSTMWRDSILTPSVNLPPPPIPALPLHPLFYPPALNSANGCLRPAPYPLQRRFRRGLRSHKPRQVVHPLRPPSLPGRPMQGGHHLHIQGHAGGCGWRGQGGEG